MTDDIPKLTRDHIRCDKCIHFERNAKRDEVDWDLDDPPGWCRRFPAAMACGKDEWGSPHNPHVTLAQTESVATYEDHWCGEWVGVVQDPTPGFLVMGHDRINLLTYQNAVLQMARDTAHAEKAKEGSDDS